MVEHNLAKVGVASSNLVSRSKFKIHPDQPTSPQRNLGKVPCQCWSVAHARRGAEARRLPAPGVHSAPGAHRVEPCRARDGVKATQRSQPSSNLTIKLIVGRNCFLSFGIRAWDGIFHNNNSITRMSNNLRRTALNDYPQPYHGFSSGSTWSPLRRLLNPLNRSTTAIISTMASSSNPSFRTAEVWTLIQYSHPITADTLTAMISLVSRSSFPGADMTVWTLRQLASKKPGFTAITL